MTLKPSLTRLCAAFGLAATLALPAGAQGQDIDTDTYKTVGETFLQACTSDGYVHYYGGPIAFSVTDMERTGFVADQAAVLNYEEGLQRTFVNITNQMSSNEVFATEGLIAIDRALRDYATQYEADTGISSGFMPYYIDMSRERHPDDCVPGSRFMSAHPQ